MSIATKTTQEIRELEIDGQLLRFKQPMLVEVEAETGAYGLWMPAFELGSAAREEAEAWEMLAELIIGTYLDYRNVTKAPKFPKARKQWQALRKAVAGFYLQQPV